MPRYFFHVHNHSGHYPDDEGADCDGPDAARRTAISGLRSILCEEAANGRLDLRGWVEVLDESGARVLVLRYDEAVEIILPEKLP